MRPIEVLTVTPDRRGRFAVFVDGGIESWSIDQIKRAVADGRIITRSQRLPEGESQ